MASGRIALPDAMKQQDCRSPEPSGKPGETEPLIGRFILVVELQAELHAAGVLRGARSAEGLGQNWG